MANIDKNGTFNSKSVGTGFTALTADGNYLIQGNGSTEVGLWPNGGALNIEVSSAVLLVLNSSQLQSLSNRIIAKGYAVSNWLDHSSTTGNDTSNTYSGLNKFGAGTSTITISNNNVDANSHIDVVLLTNDATAIVKNVIPSTNQFIVNIVACTSDTVFSWNLVGRG